MSLVDEIQNYVNLTGSKKILEVLRFYDSATRPPSDVRTANTNRRKEIIDFILGIFIIFNCGRCAVARRFKLLSLSLYKQKERRRRRRKTGNALIAATASVIKDQTLCKANMNFFYCSKLYVHALVLFYLLSLSSPRNHQTNAFSICLPAE